MRLYRYVGILHEINPEQSTIALEDVFCFGSEDRKVESFLPPSQQKYEYIVFRGSDVKDIKIVEADKEPKQPTPQNVLNDPAILVGFLTTLLGCAPLHDEIFRM
jgi:protein LSM14